jgi:hypothetical protein
MTRLQLTLLHLLLPTKLLHLPSKMLHLLLLKLLHLHLNLLLLLKKSQNPFVSNSTHLKVVLVVMSVDSFMKSVHYLLQKKWLQQKNKKRKIEMKD